MSSAKHKYRLPDGTVVRGDTYDEVVQAMADEKFSTPRSLRSYRRAVARRVRGMTQTRLDTTTNETFVKAMITNQLLKPLKAAK